MPRYVALFRGINVGKAKRIAMADLRALLETLGYTEERWHHPQLGHAQPDSCPDAARLTGGR